VTEQIRAFPLHWPDGWPRAKQREGAKFHKRQRSRVPRGDGTTYDVTRRNGLTIADGCARVIAALSAMGVPDHEIVVSTNVEPRLDGMPKSNGSAGSDPGVAVYWKRRGKRQCIAVDRYDRVADNLAAIAATLDAMRAIDRHGGAQILDRAFTGFIAIAAPEQPFQVLGISATASRGEIESAYKRLATKFHPDRPEGDHEKMARINAARDAMLESLNA
jgi:hypothetical protein